MVLRKFMGIFAITLIIGAASLAMAGVPDVENCTSSRAYTGPEKLMLLVVPGGFADATFETAWVFITPNGSAQPQVTQDATISVTVKDGALPVPQIIELYPFEDIWLVCPGVGAELGLMPCAGGNSADFATDEIGYTEFNNPVTGGGQSTGATSVVINGNALPNTVDVGYLSPDINGDGLVDLVDFQQFVVDFTGTYNFQSDYFYDGVVDLIDFQKFASWFAWGCI